MWAGSAALADVPITMSQDPRVSYQCIAINIRFLFTTFKDSAKIDFLELTDKYHT
jgi:hypothetical protein